VNESTALISALA